MKTEMRDVRLLLSDLELKVALLAKMGLKRWEIARVLGVKEGTVKSQLDRIKGKLRTDWKKDPDLLWPEISRELEEAVEELGYSKRALEGRVNYTLLRQAVEGELSPAETVILHLQGQPSPAGSKYLKKARSAQWKLIQMADRGQALFVGAGARFWLRPALAELVANKHLKFFQSDGTGELYRPDWLPYLVAGRARGTRPAYYKIAGKGARDYVQRYLLLWLDNCLETYVAELHTRMERRWQALTRMAQLAGHKIPDRPPTLEMLLAEARYYLIGR